MTAARLPPDCRPAPLTDSRPPLVGGGSHSLEGRESRDAQPGGSGDPPRDYHRMSVAEKQRHALGAQREPAVVCPRCETQTGVTDLLAHVQTRCTGPRDPHPLARWLTWDEATRIAARASISRWVAHGELRTRGEGRARRYLMRDLVQLVARQVMRGIR